MREIRDCRLFSFWKRTLRVSAIDEARLGDEIELRNTTGNRSSQYLRESICRNPVFFYFGLEELKRTKVNRKESEHGASICFGNWGF
jgi:hypothetical protein